MKTTGLAEHEEGGGNVEAPLAGARLAYEGGAYVVIDKAGALAAAGEPGPEGPSPDLPLAGVTLAVKDIIAVRGFPLRAGSRAREGAPPEKADAAIVAQLRRAGAIVVGLTALHEFAFGATGINDYAGTPHNPHDSARIPGGSSSGSAVAVAEGSARIALGTDTGGSVRIPAALSGVVGFKPRLGLYPTEGVFPLSPTLDHVGLFAKSVADIVMVHAALGHPVLPPQRPQRAGILPEQLERSDPPVRSRIERVLKQLQAEGCELVELPWPPVEQIIAASSTIMSYEAAAVHRDELAQDPSRYGPDVRARLLKALTITEEEYAAALQQREALTKQIRTALSEVDCLLGPTVSMLAPTLDEARDPLLAARLVTFTRAGNLTGLPALSLPIRGPGLPVGLQIMALEDAPLLAQAAFLETWIQ